MPCRTAARSASARRHGTRRRFVASIAARPLHHAGGLRQRRRYGSGNSAPDLSAFLHYQEPRGHGPRLEHRSPDRRAGRRRNMGAQRARPRNPLHHRLGARGGGRGGTRAPPPRAGARGEPAGGPPFTIGLPRAEQDGEIADPQSLARERKQSCWRKTRRACAGSSGICWTPALTRYSRRRTAANWQKALASKPGLKVIYMSGYTDDVLSNTDAPGPGMSFLRKPLKLDILSALIREVLDTPAVQ